MSGNTDYYPDESFLNNSSFCLDNSDEEFAGQTEDVKPYFGLSAEKKYPCAR